MGVQERDNQLWSLYDTACLLNHIFITLVSPIILGEGDISLILLFQRIQVSSTLG